MASLACTFHNTLDDTVFRDIMQFLVDRAPHALTGRRVLIASPLYREDEDVALLGVVVASGICLPPIFLLRDSSSSSPSLDLHNPFKYASLMARSDLSEGSMIIPVSSFHSFTDHQFLRLISHVRFHTFSTIDTPVILCINYDLSHVSLPSRMQANRNGIHVLSLPHQASPHMDPFNTLKPLLCHSMRVNSAFHQDKQMADPSYCGNSFENRCQVKMQLLSHLFLSIASPMLIMRAFEDSGVWPLRRQQTNITPSASSLSTLASLSTSIREAALLRTPSPSNSVNSNQPGTMEPKTKKFKVSDRVIVNLTKYLEAEEGNVQLGLVGTISSVSCSPASDEDPEYHVTFDGGPALPSDTLAAVAPSFSVKESLLVKSNNDKRHDQRERRRAPAVVVNSKTLDMESVLFTNLFRVEIGHFVLIANKGCDEQKRKRYYQQMENISHHRTRSASRTNIPSSVRSSKKRKADLPKVDSEPVASYSVGQIIAITSTATVDSDSSRDNFPSTYHAQIYKRSSFVNSRFFITAEVRKVPYESMKKMLLTINEINGDPVNSHYFQRSRTKNATLVSFNNKDLQGIRVE